MDNTDGVKNGLLYGQQDSLCSVVEVLATEASRGRVELRPGCGEHPLPPLKPFRVRVGVRQFSEQFIGSDVFLQIVLMKKIIRTT